MIFKIQNFYFGYFYRRSFEKIWIVVLNFYYSVSILSKLLNIELPLQIRFVEVIGYRAISTNRAICRGGQ